MKLKHLLRYPSCIQTAKALLKRDEFLRPDYRGSIGLDLYTDHLLFDCGRHLTCIAALATQAGLEVHLRCSKWMLAAIAHKPLGRQFLSMDHVQWLAPSQIFPGHAVVLCDVAEYQANRIHAGQHLIEMLIGSDVVPGTMAMPYPTHPRQITSESIADRGRLRQQTKHGIFFAGNQKQRYGRSKMENQFGVISRLEIISTLQQAFPQQVCTSVAAASNVQDIVLVDTSVDRIDVDQWMSTLAAHQFFVCCPGAAQPMCHNVIEAMSVGVIPIIEYDDRFRPVLQDGENCIAFRGRQGLVKSIQRINAMSVGERLRISANVSRYFDRHLDGVVFLRRLFEAGRLRRDNYVSMPFHESNLFDPASVSVEADKNDDPKSIGSGRRHAA
ncbi:hypothetical protein LOC67_14630 [Stieleria sp. JC731]|uniref:hypothetical protein n=1 Tax=Pirellulaceae TaxID=2691357 RepID=UPI001E404861|nr:hypothetical protein [Stieleria sp. JC731]MCC9601793.1 hypothetical protein [Stieleria sp. JC731]